MPQTAVKKKVSMIPAKPQYDRSIKLSEKKLRVAAYCRVSTELEEQESSYEAQVEYYTRKIEETDNWKMAGIYADDGKSATNTKKRDDFNAMIKDALDGKIDMILTKSVSRFARNTVDFMTKKKVINKGIVPQYYVEDDHEPIIPKELFYRVQEELARRASMNKSAVTRKKNQKSKFSSEYALTGLLLCGDCGQEYRRVTWSRNGKKKIVWRCSNRLTNGTKHCKKSETLEEGVLNRAVMEAINRITRGDGDFVGAFRQNVIRVIGSYYGEQEPDEYDEKIKEKEEEMVALIAENARVGSYTDEFDERYRRIAEEITILKEEQIEARRKKKLAASYEQRLRDMDSFLEKQTCQIPEFDNDLVRRLIASIKVVSAEKLIIQFQSGIVMEQEIRYE